jgi:hypothetical protein
MILGLQKAGVLRPFALEELDQLDLEYLPFILEYIKTQNYIAECDARMASQKLQLGVR